MPFFKKNPIFTVVVVLLLLVFAVGCYFSVSESKAVKNAQKAVSNNEKQLNALLYLDPAPSGSNVVAAEENVEQLTTALEQIRADLQEGESIIGSADGIRVMTALPQFIRNFRRLAENHTRDEGEAAAIALPRNFGFGFERYIDQTPIPENPEHVVAIDKQRQILNYLLGRLIESNPLSFVAVERELVELSSEEGFVIDPEISARVPDAINTMAFRITFTGYTEALRRFLDSLAKFELPIVVRSISVEREGDDDAVVSEQFIEKGLKGLDGIFDALQPFEAESADPLAGGESEAVPVIDEVESKFTVILEFIEVILPEEQTEDLPDPE